MHNAPPVAVPVGRFVWGHRIVLILALSSALVCGPAALRGWQSGSLVSCVLIGIAWLMAAGGSWWAFRREFLAPGELSWDGADWWYRVHGGSAQQVSVRLRWDAGKTMLLGLRATESAGHLDRYIWLQARQAPQQWHALRCAVHGRDTL